MLVKELKQLLKGINGNMKVLIPITDEFNGIFYSPCIYESGLGTMGTDFSIDEEEIRERELLNKEIPSEDIFLLVPCGFTEEHDNSHQLN